MGKARLGDHEIESDRPRVTALGGPKDRVDKSREQNDPSQPGFRLSFSLR
jgi:hypothetical protein